MLKFIILTEGLTQAKTFVRMRTDSSEGVKHPTYIDNTDWTRRLVSNQKIASHWPDQPFPDSHISAAKLLPYFYIVVSSVQTSCFFYKQIIEPLCLLSVLSTIATLICFSELAHSPKIYTHKALKQGQSHLNYNSKKTIA